MTCLLFGARSPRGREGTNADGESGISEQVRRVDAAKWLVIFKMILEKTAVKPVKFSVPTSVRKQWEWRG